MEIRELYREVNNRLVDNEQPPMNEETFIVSLAVMGCQGKIEIHGTDVTYHNGYYMPSDKKAGVKNDTI